MSAAEMLDWARFAAFHPFPVELADMHGAQLAAIIANVNRDPKHQPTPFAVSQFMMLGQRRNAPAPIDEADKFLEAFPEG